MANFNISLLEPAEHLPSPPASLPGNQSAILKCIFIPKIIIIIIFFYVRELHISSPLHQHSEKKKGGGINSISNETIHLQVSEVLWDQCVCEFSLFS